MKTTWLNWFMRWAYRLLITWATLNHSFCFVWRVFCQHWSRWTENINRPSLQSLEKRWYSIFQNTIAAWLFYCQSGCLGKYKYLGFTQCPSQGVQSRFDLNAVLHQTYQSLLRQQTDLARITLSRLLLQNESECFHHKMVGYNKWFVQENTPWKESYIAWIHS